MAALAVLADCPRCGRPGVPILYGLPTHEAFETAERGERSRRRHAEAPGGSAS